MPNKKRLMKIAVVSGIGILITVVLVSRCVYNKKRKESENITDGEHVESRKNKPCVDIVAEDQLSYERSLPIKVLIVGKHSYVGTNLKQYLEKDPNYIVDELETLDESWKTFDFSLYDIVYQVAGIAHRKETKKNSQLYYDVNSDLAFSVAEKVRAAGVERFIYMSTMNVYGLEHSNNTIGVSTPTIPVTNYGKSKLQAERRILELSGDNFHVAILRPPMVYGPNAPGNLEKLFKVVRAVRLFPTIRNERSSISIDNLCEGIKRVIENGYLGVVIMQDSHYRCTVDIIHDEMEQEGVGLHFTSAFNPIIRVLIGRVSVISKVFGNLRYSFNDNCSERSLKDNNL